jgi:hypothetical protein
MEDVDSAAAALRIFDYPSGRSTSPIGLEPRIKHKVRYRHNSSCLGDFSHGGRNESEWRPKPRKRPICFTKGVRNRLIAPSKIQLESVDVPQITKPMVERVIYQKMPRGCNGASLFRPGRNLATNDTETCFHFEIVQDCQ